jgi:hypothetical protein
MALGLTPNFLALSINLAFGFSFTSFSKACQSSFLLRLFTGSGSKVSPTQPPIYRCSSYLKKSGCLSDTTAILYIIHYSFSQINTVRHFPSGFTIFINFTSFLNSLILI